jgi:predicted DNA-binding transcriptional regulator YafY
MDYYSHGRGQFTKRRITPISLEAETYLHAYCHLRREERVFRLTRIADLRPVGGWSAYRRAGGSTTASKAESNQNSPKKSEQANSEKAAKKSAEDNPQMSLLDP